VWRCGGGVEVMLRMAMIIFPRVATPGQGIG